MLETIAIILLVIWLAGELFAVTFGGLIHLLLLVALILIVVRLIQGKPVV